MPTSPKTHLSLLVAAPGDHSDALRPLSQVVTLLQKGLPSQLERVRFALAPILEEVEPLIARYENTVLRMQDVLDRQVSQTDRLAILNRISRNQIDAGVNEQHEGLARLIERTIRRVAGKAERQGSTLFSLKPRKRKKTASPKLATTPGPASDPYSGLDTFQIIERSQKIRKSRAESWRIEDVIDVLDQLVKRNPGQYYAAWAEMQPSLIEWWSKLLRVYTAYMESSRYLLTAAPVKVAALAEDVAQFESLVRNVVAGKKVSVSRALYVPGRFCHQTNVAAAVDLLMGSIDERFVPDVRSIKRSVRDIHAGSSQSVSEATLFDAMLEAVGRWLTDLKRGVFRSTISATVDLASRAQGELPDREDLHRVVNGAVMTRYRFVSVPVTDRSRKTSLQIKICPSKRLCSNLLATYLDGVDLNRDPTWAEVMPDFLSRIHGDLQASTKHRVDVGSRDVDGVTHLILNLATSTTVKRVAGSRPALAVKTRSGLTSVLGTAEGIFNHALDATEQSSSIRAIDAYSRFGDTPSGVSYSVSVVFAVDAEKPTRQSYEEIRQALVFSVTMANEETIRSAHVTSRSLMISEFVEVHGAGKVRVAGGRSLPSRIVLSHPEIPGRTFEVFRKRRRGSKIKYTIRLNGQDQMVSGAEGWREVQ